MSFQITPAHSSRIRKSSTQTSATSAFKRSLSGTSSRSPQKKSIISPTEPGDFKEDDERLNDTGLIASLASDLNFRDIPQFIIHIRTHTFSPLPLSGGGFSSARISEILNFRARLPPIVSLAHVNALSKNGETRVEREVVELAQKGVVRRVVIPGRGVGPKAVGEGLVLMGEWVDAVRASEKLEGSVKEKYIRLLQENKASSTILGTQLTSKEITELIGAGFLTNSTHTSASSALLYSRPSSSALSSLISSKSISKSAAGTLAAVGGHSATAHVSGGSGPSNVHLSQSQNIQQFNLSLPNTGAHIKLLIESRTHLLTLLKKMSKYHEAPIDALRERWDGGVSGDDAASRAKKSRGEFKGVLLARTKKWKAFHGLRFEWVLEECVGAGLIEVFDTGSVGLGVRVI